MLFDRAVPTTWLVRPIEFEEPVKCARGLGRPAGHSLVLCHSLIVSYTDFGFVRASSIFICQSTPRYVALTSVDHAWAS
jgi:hypothetical protein